jgi:hypothetical protein
MRGAPKRLKLKSVATSGEAAVSSVARLLSTHDAEQLAATARCLPPGWVVAVSPPHGQLTIRPRAHVDADHRTWVADGSLGVIYRIDARRGVRFH